MKRGTRQWVAAGIGVLMLGAAGVVASGFAAADVVRSAASPSKGKAGTTRTITLITGDRVVVDPAGKVVATIPGKGRKGQSFATYRTADKHVIVVPSDARQLIGTGVLDRRLFDVTTLLRFGYDDARTSSVPLLVEATTANSAAVTASGVRTVRVLTPQNAVAVRVEKSAAPQWWDGIVAQSGKPSARAADVRHIWLDGKRFPTDAKSNEQIGVPEARKAGYTGKGVTVAVLDTGVDANHPDLKGRVADTANFTEEASAADGVGHGTHVASIIAGSGVASKGAYAGVAPDAKIVAGKVCGEVDCSESAILAGMQWAAEQKHARVVNLSLGGGDSAEIDPLEQAVNDLSARFGTLFVIAAGNEGPGTETVGSPGSADAALTVGAVDRVNGIAGFSSRGPRIGDFGLKPEITAPGVGIIAAKAAGTQMGDPVGSQYVSASGTSMATPHVVGVAALLAQLHPDWSGESMKAALVASAKTSPALSVWDQGAGRVDAARVINQGVVSQPASMSFGVALWPHTDDKPLVRKLTYRNLGGGPLTLALSAKITGPAGARLPAGMFTMSASSVTVPAKGETSITVTMNTKVAGPNGHYIGHLVATSRGTQVVTPIAINKEAESYNVTITTRDRTGAASGQDVMLSGFNSTESKFLFDPTGSIHTRLVAGMYDVTAFIETLTPDGDHASGALMSAPMVKVNRDLSLVFDARRATRVGLTPPNREAVGAGDSANYSHVLPHSTPGATVGESVGKLYVGNVGAPAPSSQYSGLVASQWMRRAADGSFDGSPYSYTLALQSRGRLPIVTQKQFRASELGRVDDSYAAVMPNRTAWKLAFAIDPLSPSGGSVATESAYRLPATRTEYYGGEGVQWLDSLMVFNAADPLEADKAEVLDSVMRNHRAGSRQSVQWNTGPFGPAMPSSLQPSVYRSGDLIVVAPGMWADRAGHDGHIMGADAETTVIYRNGTEIGRADGGYAEFTVPAGRASYRVVQHAKQSFMDLSTDVTAEWFFTSGRVPATSKVPLPVSAVRMTPSLANNGVTVGTQLRIPITVDRQVVSGLTKVKSLTVDVSFDDGKTWRSVPVTKRATGWEIVVRHPNAAGFLSWRATATDNGGDTVKQTVLRAYRITAPTSSK